jgi:hypothetical protein
VNFNAKIEACSLETLIPVFHTPLRSHLKMEPRCNEITKRLNLSVLLSFAKAVLAPPFSRNTKCYSIYKKSNPITGLDRPLGSQEVEAPRFFRQSAHEGGKVVSPTHRPPLPPRKDSWYSFLLEAESTPGPQCDRNDYVTETFQ